MKSNGVTNEQALKDQHTGDSLPSAGHCVQAFLRIAGARIATHNSDIARLSASVLRCSAKKTDLDTVCRGSANVEATDQLVPDFVALASRFSHLAESDELIRCLTDCMADLHWRQAGFGQLPTSYKNKIMVAELVGPNGMVNRHDVRCGLLLQREYVHYPRHSHAAEELYLVIAGTAKWAVDENLPTTRSPGAFVHHHSLQPHCMTTGAEPVFALWAWSGDVSGTSYTCL